MKVKLLILINVVLLGLNSRSQSLPPEMYYSPDGKILYTGGQPSTGFYDTSSVKNVYLNFTQPSYWSMLTAYYSSETNIAATMIYDGVTYPNVGVRFRGNTSYTTIGASQKKSFAVSVDFTDPDLTVLGYNDLKFNNAHQDPTFMREVLYNRMASRHTPIAKGNYIHLYLNDQDWGLYPNIQSVDKSFLNEWFLSNDGARFRANPDENTSGGPNWGDGTAGLNYLSASTAPYQQYYSLKSSDLTDDPWQKLVEACEVLNTAAAANIETVKATIDVDKALWFLACENIFTDDDSYVMKGKMDYMIYYEPETGRTIPLEYDGNSTFANTASTTWTPFKNATNPNYPLLFKLLNIPEWRQRYLAHYRTILNETFTTANANAIIDEMNGQISALVATDPKKLYSTSQYTIGVPILKNIISTRRNYLMANPEVAQVAPEIASATYFNSSMAENVIPVSNEQANIQAVVTSTSGINKVKLYYATGIVGNFTSIQMYDDGAHNDNAAADGIYGASIPGYIANTMVRYYIEAVANNATFSASYLPTGAEHDIFVYHVAALQNPNGVVINEIMASNTTIAVDELGEYEDWTELYNNNSAPVDLSGYYLSDDLTNLAKWQIPAGTIIPANGYLIFWNDDETTDGPMHTNWKLSASGEDVVLSDPSLTILDSFTFGAQTTDMGYARVPNGTGSLVIQASTFNADNESLATSDFEFDSVIVFPNPASESVNILHGERIAGKPIALFNVIGQKVFSGTAAAEMKINTGEFSAGVYVLKCEGMTRKIILRN